MTKRKEVHADPHRSAVLARGAVGTFHTHSWQGRYLRDVERQLLDACRDQPDGPTAAQRLVVSRLANIALHLTQLEQRFSAAGQLPLEQLRLYSSLHQVFISGIRDILHKPIPKLPSTAPESVVPVDPLASLRAYLQRDPVPSPAPPEAADPAAA